MTYVLVKCNVCGRGGVQLAGLEVWFQRASDVVRKLVRGDLDLGIVGADMFAEIAADSKDLILLHDALDFGHCHLALGVPTTGRFADVNSLEVHTAHRGAILTSPAKTYLLTHIERSESEARSVLGSKTRTAPNITAVFAASARGSIS